MMMNNMMAEDEYKDAAISVWWDVDRCTVPRMYEAQRISHQLSSALRKLNYNGPLSISAYGQKMSYSVRSGLSYTGISVQDIACRKVTNQILAEMMFFANHHPDPMNFMLISGDDILVNEALRGLVHRRHNVLLAHPPQYSCSGPLFNHIKTRWNWSSLLGLSEHPFSFCTPLNEQPKAKAGYEEAATGLWWDLENCPIPKGCDPRAVADKLNLALSNLNYRGPRSMTAYGYTTNITPAIKAALSTRGIYVRQIKPVPEMLIQWILLDMLLLFPKENPAPANVILISGNGRLTRALGNLQSLGRYNIILVHHPRPSKTLLRYANTSLLWRNIVDYDQGESSGAKKD